MNRQRFESRPCTRYSKIDLRSICDELNIHYLRSDSKSTLCDLITLYFEQSDNIEQQQQLNNAPITVPRYINQTLNATPYPARYINQNLLVREDQQLHTDNTLPINLFTPRYINQNLLVQEHQEDQQLYKDINYKSKISHEPIACTNESLIDLEPYVSLKDTVQIFTLNSDNKYTKSVCFSYSELKEYLKSDLDTTTPGSLMTIYRLPRFPMEDQQNATCDDSGRGCIATGKFVFKLPVTSMYITHGSLMRIICRPETNWYALPLYGGKRRRVGNLSEIYAQSMNHGQIPGFVIYKLFTKDEIEQGVVVKAIFPETIEERIRSFERDYFIETGSDYFDFIIPKDDQNTALHSLLNADIKEIVNEFINNYLEILEQRAPGLV